MKKAKIEFRWPDGSLEYSYRGKNYSVNPNLYTSTAQQHRQEQERIDIAVEREQRVAQREANTPYRYENTAEYGFEIFWNYVED